MMYLFEIQTSEIQVPCEGQLVRRAASALYLRDKVKVNVRKYMHVVRCARRTVLHIVDIHTAASMFGGRFISWMQKNICNVRLGITSRCYT